jgi:hypothetical protein
MHTEVKHVIAYECPVPGALVLKQPELGSCLLRPSNRIEAVRFLDLCVDVQQHSIHL